MKLFFDFDHTLFDTMAMQEVVTESLQKLGIPPKDYREAYNLETQWKMFTVDGIARRLEKTHKVDANKIKRVFTQAADLAELFVYEDTVEHLQTLSAVGHDLYLLSWGETDWQSKKIVNTKLDKHFTQTITIQELKANKLEEITKEDLEELMVIDDKPAELRAIRERFPQCHLVRMRRANGKYSDQDTPEGMHEASHMPDVLALVNKLNS